MSKIITLEEAYANATPPPLSLRSAETLKPTIVGTLPNGSDTDAIAVANQWHKKNTNAALLVHAFNVLPEVVAALDAACRAASDCLPPSGGSELDPLYYKAKLLAIDEAATLCSKALAKANQVQLP